MPIKPRETVILVCDIQERFRSAVWKFDAVVAISRKMIRVAKILNIPIITTEQNPNALGATVGELNLADLPKELNLGVFAKKKFSMVIPEVSDVIRSKGFKNAIIVGIETALELLDNGIKPYVLADGVSSCNAQEVPIALSTVRQAGGTVSTSESIIFQLVGDASEPYFKAVSGLIKEEKAATASALSALLGGGQQTKSNL